MTSGAVVSAVTSLGLGAKLVLFVTAIGLGSLVTVGVKTVVSPPPTLHDVRVVAPDPVPAPAPAIAKADVEPVIEATEPVVEETAPVVEATEPVVAVVTPPAAPPAPARPSARPATPRQSAPVVAEPPAPVVSQTPELPLPPVTPTENTGVVEATTETGFSTVVEVNFPSCDTTTEAKVASGARRLLTEQRAEHALWLLGAYQRRCPSGRWSDEAWRVRLSSLCLIGRNTEAASLLEWLTTEYPQRRDSITSELQHTCDPEVLSSIPSSGARR